MGASMKQLKVDKLRKAQKQTSVLEAESRILHQLLRGHPLTLTVVWPPKQLLYKLYSNSYC